MTLLKAFHQVTKMTFNPDISKQAQEITFPEKNVDVSHPTLYFNKTPVADCSYQKHSGQNGGFCCYKWKLSK